MLLNHESKYFMPEGFGTKTLGVNKIGTKMSRHQKILAQIFLRQKCQRQNVGSKTVQSLRTKRLPHTNRTVYPPGHRSGKDAISMVALGMEVSSSVFFS